MTTQSRINDAALRRWGEEVIFKIPAGDVPVTAVLEWETPEQVIGTTRTDRPKPYLMVRDSDIADIGLAARQNVIIRGKTISVVAEPLADGDGMSRIYVRGTF